MRHVYTFEKLEVWRESKTLVKRIYEVTTTFPSEEKFGLISQLRRAAVSIVSNIAEGSSRKTVKDQVRFLEIAYGSAVEVYCQIQIAYDLDFINSELEDELVSEIQKITNKLNRLKEMKERNL